MIIETLPSFDKNRSYKEYSPIEGGYSYRFVTITETKIVFVNRLAPKGKTILFKDNKGRVWMKMTSHSIIISKNYAWDGCTPKKWWGFWWGTPDFEDTVLASLVHDVLIQFSKTKHFPFTRKQIDEIFKEILEYNDFLLTSLYYSGVRIGSKFPDKNYKVESVLTNTPDY